MEIDKEAQGLLAQINVLRQPSDLDLLLFFARHPRCHLSTDQISAFLGYGFNEISSGLDRLLEGGYLTRTPNPRNSARLYVFALGADGGGGWLPALLGMASTREGRLALVATLKQPSADGKSTDGNSRPDMDGERAGVDNAHMLRFRDRRIATERSALTVDALRERKGAQE